MNPAEEKNRQNQLPQQETKEEIESVSLNYIIFTAIIGLLLLLNLLGIFPTFLGINTAIILTLIGGYKIFYGAVESLFKRKISVDLAIALAAAAALAINQYLAAAEVIFIMLVGEALESFAVDRTRGAIKKLIDLSPKMARVIREGKEVEVEVEKLVIGDKVIVKPGERVPVDGEVLSGRSSVDQSTITGESIPVEKNAGSAVYSGTINQLGLLKVRADKVGKGTLLFKIIHLVEEAQAQKAPIQKVADKYAKYFVPAIILLAGACFLVTRDVVKSVSILIIACPCALVLATPTAIFAGIGRLAKEGILVKGGSYLEQMGRVDLIAFDKTGTLTQGHPKIVNIIPFKKYSEQRILSMAATVEQYSEHLLADIIVEEAKNRSITFGETNDFQIKPGLGVEALYQGETLLVGNKRLIEENNLEFDSTAQRFLKEIDQNGQTAILIANGKELAGVIAVQDEIRSEAARTIKKLKDLGIKKLTLLTGDNEKVARQVAQQTGIEEFSANLLPDAKVAMIKEWQKEGYTVAMIGDGINDAPSLTSADVGIAMGGIGSDIAIETADVIFMADDLSHLEKAITIGKKTIKTIKQNILYFAVIFNSLAVVAASTMALVTPVVAAIVHQFSSLLVVCNSLRLLADKMKNMVTGWANAFGGGLVYLGRNQFKPAWQNHYKLIVNGLLVLLLVVYLTSGLTIISTNQLGVVQRFGKKITDDLKPGLHLFYPWPIDKVTKIRRGIERVEIGFRKIPTTDNEPDQTSGPTITAYEWEVQHQAMGYQDMNDEALIFTGDENFLEMDMVVQYLVKDPSAFLFKISGFQDAANLVRFHAQSASRKIIGKMKTDKILTEDRHEIETQVTHLLQKDLDSLDSGLLIKGVYLQSVHPPIEVADTFRAVVNAHEEKNMLINLAEAYHNEQIPLVRGKVKEEMEKANAYQIEMINKAVGEGNRFTQMNKNYVTYPEITSLRLYLEMVESVLPETKKFILDEKRKGQEELTIFGSKKLEIIINNITKELTARGKKQSN